MPSEYLLWENHIPVFLSRVTWHVDVISKSDIFFLSVCSNPSLTVTNIYIHTTNFGENVGDIINYEWRYKK